MSETKAGGSTVICVECGSANQDDATFCGGCGAYLEWDGERARPGEPGPAAVPEPVVVPESKPTLVDRVKAGLGLEPEAAAGPAEAGSTDSASVHSSPADAAAPASAPSLPVGQPTAVKPGAEANLQGRRKPAPVDEFRPKPGEVICGQCGAGNVRERKFCRRCGKDLLGATVLPPLPWWRRLFRRRPKPIAAGTRPVLRRRSRAPRRLLVLVVVAAAVLGLGRLAWPWVGGAIGTVRDRIAGSQLYEPSQMVASSSTRGHGAALARDGRGETYWAPAAPGEVVGQYLEARFDQPFRLVRVQYLNGASRDDGKFLATRRPSKVVLSVTSSDGTATTITKTLVDDAKPHEIDVGVSDVTKVRLTIESIKKPVRDSQRTLVALGEMAFLRRS